MSYYAEDIKKLYTKVLEEHKNTFNVDTRRIKAGIRNLAKAYIPNQQWIFLNQSPVVDFNNPGDRCAYLFKYAMLHTALVCDVLEQALNIYRVKENIARKQRLNLCSLGSGPGSDILALLLVFKENNFGPKYCYASLIDCSVQWKHVFNLIQSELKGATGGTVISGMSFDYQYLDCDLLKFNDDKVRKAIENADIITMVKFLSAAACKDSRIMLKKICSAMKLGAMLLFIDNAAGGFHEIMESITESSGMESVFGPMKHYDYEEQKFNIRSYEATSQFKTRVSIEIWEKVYEVAIAQCAEASDEIDGKWQPQSYVQKQCNLELFPETDDSESFQLKPENGSNSEDSSCCIIM